MSLLSVNDLTIHAAGKRVVNELSFCLAPGETLAIMGASGAGKTLTALSILNLLPAGVERVGGRILIDGVETSQLPRLRGGVAGMIFQEPMSSLNPLMRIGAQVAEVIDLHGGNTNVLDALAQAGIKDPARMARAHAHELSGGERQRVMIAMALANDPKLLIADEPTTSLDSDMARQILDLVATAAKARGLGVLLITHDPELARRYADRAATFGTATAIRRARISAA